MWPVFLIGFLMVWIMFWFSFKSGKSSKLEERLLPVTVIQLPSNKLFLSINFKTEGIPPTLCKSSIKNLPLGFKSARYGVVSIIF